MADRRASRDPDLYEVLGVRPDANAVELRRAYRRRLHQLHPDKRRAEHDRVVVDADAEDRSGPDLAGVLHAYEVLRDPQRRASYDAERAVASARRSHPPRGAGSRAPADRAARPGRTHRDSRKVFDIGFLRIELGIDDLG